MEDEKAILSKLGLDYEVRHTALFLGVVALVLSVLVQSRKARVP